MSAEPVIERTIGRATVALMTGDIAKVPADEIEFLQKLGDEPRIRW